MTEDEVKGACRPTRRLTVTALIVWAVLTFALPLAALTLNAVSVASFPLGFWMAAQGVLILLVALALVFARRAGGQRTSDSPASSLQFAGECITSAGFIGLSGLIAALGFDGLAYPIGLAAGLALMTIVVAPRLVLYPAATLTGFMSSRYGGVWPARVTLLIAILASALILAADLRGAGLALQGLSGAGYRLAAAVALIIVALTWLSRPLLNLPGPRGLVYGLLLLVFCATLVAMAWAQDRFPIPQLSYGGALDDIKLLERKLLEAKLADLKAMRPMAQPFLQLSMVNFSGLIIALACGLAALPHILGRHLTQTVVAPGDGPRLTAWALAFLSLFLAGLAAFAALSRVAIDKLLVGGIKTTELPAALVRASGLGWVEICGLQSASQADLAAACAKLPGQKGLLKLQDLAFTGDGYLFTASSLAGVPAIVWIGLAGAGLLAAVVSAHAIVAGLVRAELETRSAGYDLDLRSEAMALGLLLAAYMIAILDQREIPALVSEGFALIASALFPAVVLGLFWRRTTATAAVASMMTGLLVAGGYILAVRFFPVQMFEMTGSLSNAAPAVVAKFMDAKAHVLAVDDAARAAAQSVLNKQAQAIANWWGLKPGAAALLAMPLAIVIAIVCSALAKVPRIDGSA